MSKFYLHMFFYSYMEIISACSGHINDVKRFDKGAHHDASIRDPIGKAAGAEYNSKASGKGILFGPLFPAANRT